ncbi:thioredoxin-interacting protein-like [Ruditapes philippinarum]|uniref:thioredoxin-interacting protein-like n=1 Tax=Ruditapes philippinarum TaxID=129788 RepID=UPI00295BF2E1|nr:thioredoxin-interacting protein-like [Ruditapes philippinarum]
MPAINSVFIKVYNQKPVYRPGDELKGEWTVDIGEPISVKNVSVSFRGATLTRWANTESKADDNIGFEDITTQEKIVFPTSNRTGETVEYPAGKYVYKFSFKVPTGMLPSTYEGKYGAIRYWLAFDIERPVLRSHVRRLKVITVLDEIDVNIPEYSKYVGRKTEKVVTKALGFGNQGVVTLFAQTDRGAYCSGEKIYIKYIAENKSDKDLGMVRMELMQKVKFRASGEEKYKYQCLTKTFVGEMKKVCRIKKTSLSPVRLFLLRYCMIVFQLEHFTTNRFRSKSK